MTTFTQDVDGIASVHERDDVNNVLDLAGEIHLADYAGFDTYMGLRLTNVTIPQGSVITEAVVTFAATVGGDDDFRGQIYCEAADDAAAWNIGVGTADVTGRTTTSAVVGAFDDNTGVGPYTTPDFSVAVQEVINRSGFASGQDLNIIIYPGGASRVFVADPAAGNITVTIEYESANAANSGALSIRGVRGVAPTSAGHQTNLTVAGFGTPQAAYVVAQQVTSEGTITANGSISYGAYANNGTLPFSWYNSQRSQDAQAGADSIKSGTDGSIIGFLNPSSSAYEARGSVYFTANGIGIYWFDPPPSAYLITAYLFRGFDDVAAGTEPITNAAGGGETTDISVGFDADFAIFGHVNAQGIPDITSEMLASCGFVTREGGSPVQAAIGFTANTPANPTDANGVVHNTSGILSTGDQAGGVFRDASAAFISNGIRATRNDTATATSVAGWLALKLPTGAQISLDIIDTPTSTGVQSYAGPSFEPDVCLAFNSMQDAADAVFNAGMCGFGMSIFNENEEFSVAVSDQDNVATSQTASLSSAKAVSILDEDGTLLYEATLDSFDSDGYNLDFTTADGTARKMIVVALAAPASTNITNVGGVTGGVLGFNRPIGRVGV